MAFARVTPYLPILKACRSFPAGCFPILAGKLCRQSGSVHGPEPLREAICPATRGVRGIRLHEGDYVKALIVVDDKQTLLIAGIKGQGKRSEFSEYRVQRRGGYGIIAIKTHGVAGAITVSDSDEMMLFTKSGQSVRSPVKDVRVIGRTTMGVRLINLTSDDQLVGICKVVEYR